MPFLSRYLDASEILGEFLFGAIMVLTFTLGASVAGGYEKGLLLAALGCNIAWGVIDGVLLVMSNRYARRRERDENAVHLPFTREDAGTLVSVFLLVVSSAIPAALPFFVIADPQLALRVSNALMVVLLFAAGWAYGRHIDVPPWLSGLVLAAIGIALVAIAVALGG